MNAFIYPSPSLFTFQIKSCGLWIVTIIISKHTYKEMAVYYLDSHHQTPAMFPLQCTQKRAGLSKECPWLVLPQVACLLMDPLLCTFEVCRELN